MNHVNLIGTVSSRPKFLESKGGTIASFTLATKEPFIDVNGEQRYRKYLHKIRAWGNWVKVIEELAEPGLSVAIEGKLKTSFFHDHSGRKFAKTEVEINDLVII